MSIARKLSLKSFPFVWIGTVDPIIHCNWLILYVQQMLEKLCVYSWLRRSFVPIFHPQKRCSEPTSESREDVPSLQSTEEKFRIHGWLQRRSLYLHVSPEVTFYTHNHLHRRFFMSLFRGTLLNYISLQRRLSILQLTPEESATKKRNVTFPISIIIIVMLPLWINLFILFQFHKIKILF